jgi:hypothetical protein
MQPRLLASSSAAAAMAPGVGGVEPVVTLDQVPRWSDSDQRLFPAAAEEEVGSEPPPYLSFSDPLTGDVAGGGGGDSRFPVDQEINSRIYLWRRQPWNLEVDAVVNSTNEVGRVAVEELGTILVLSSCDLLGSCRAWTRRTAVPACVLLQVQGSPRNVPPWYCLTIILGLLKSVQLVQFRMLNVIRLLWVLFQGGCRTGMAKMTNAYDLPARQVVRVLFCIC